MSEPAPKPPDRLVNLLRHDSESVDANVQTLLANIYLELTYFRSDVAARASNDRETLAALKRVEASLHAIGVWLIVSAGLLALILWRLW